MKTTDLAKELESFFNSDEGKALMAELKTDNKYIFLAVSEGSIMGMENNLYLTGDGLKWGMMDAYVNNVRRSPILSDASVEGAAEELLNPKISCVPEENRSHVLDWIKQAKEKARNIPHV